MKMAKEDKSMVLNKESMADISEFLKKYGDEINQEVRSRSQNPALLSEEAQCQEAQKLEEEGKRLSSMIGNLNDITNKMNDRENGASQTARLDIIEAHEKVSEVKKNLEAYKQNLKQRRALANSELEIAKLDAEISCTDQNIEKCTAAQQKVAEVEGEDERERHNMTDHKLMIMGQLNITNLNSE